ncbi:MAG: hypothetical protein AAFQ83_02220 [Bacteroidota bacterium]
MPQLRFFFGLCLLLPFLSKAQPVGYISVENLAIMGSDVSFELYFQTDGSTTDKIYVGHTDIRLEINPASFTNPSINKVENPAFLPADQRGYNTFTPVSTDMGGPIDQAMQKAYFDSTYVALLNTQDLVVYIYGPEVNNLLEFQQQIAEVDDLLNTHCLGRFEITGYNGGNTGLRVKLEEGWPEVGSFDANDVTAPEFEADLVNIMADPILPITWRFQEAKWLPDGQVQLQWGVDKNENTLRYEVRRLGDTENIGLVSAFPGQIVYQWLDARPDPARLIYEIIAIDADGKQHKVNVEVQNLKNASVIQFLIVPNLVKDELLWLSMSPTTEIEGVIRDLEGKIIKQTRYQAGLINYSWEVSDLPTGMYFLEIRQADGHRVMLRFIKS